MKNANKYCGELDELCATIKTLALSGEYQTCIDKICEAMKIFPHAPQPHNLLGIILEKTGDHMTAMKHFRASWALDPTYSPANHNLTTYGTFFSHGNCAYDETDVPQRPSNDKNLVVEYDSNGIGHVVKE